MITDFDLIAQDVMKERDIDSVGDFFVGGVRDDSPGVRVKVRKATWYCYAIVEKNLTMLHCDRDCWSMRFKLLTSKHSIVQSWVHVELPDVLVHTLNRTSSAGEAMTLMCIRVMRILDAK
jgi:hypothetical protein